MSATRREVLQLYKTLIYMGRDYPKGGDFFLNRLRSAFRRNLSESDPKQISQLLDRGRYVERELIALYRLKKYRHLKANYYDAEEKERENLHEGNKLTNLEDLSLDGKEEVISS